MMKRRLFLFVSLLMWSCALFSQQSTRYAIYFETGRHELGEDARQTLDQVLEELQYPQDYSVDIFAHTDSRGSTDYNLKLAERRAQSVTAYLAERGLKTEKTTTASLGENDPAYTNADESGRKLNRRVDLVVNIVSINSLNELTEHLSENRPQHFTVSLEHPIELTGKQGTTLQIPAGSFEFTDGSGMPDAPIDIILRETYSMADMILADLTTTCNGKLLETAGMVYIDASSGGKPLRLKEDARIRMAMPASSLQEGMELFLGEQNDEGRLVNWQATGQGYLRSPTAAIESPAMPQNKFKMLISSTKFPEAPIMPRAPDKPVAPKREQVIYKPPFMEGLLMSKGKRHQKEEEMYQKKVKEYKRYLKSYEERKYPNYLKALAKYETDLPNYFDRIKTWKAEVGIDTLETEITSIKTGKGEFFYRLSDPPVTGFSPVSADERILDSYVFQLSRLGWVNCDIFSKTPEERMELAIRDEDDTDERIYIILRDRNSLLNTSKKKTFGLYTSEGIPKMTPVTILAIKIEKGLPKMALRETHAGEESEYRLDYKSCSLGDIRQALNGLN